MIDKEERRMRDAAVESVKGPARAAVAAETAAVVLRVRNLERSIAELRGELSHRHPEKTLNS